MLISTYQSLLIVDRYLYDLLILNTLCDPIIYVIRINDVQTGYRLMFYKCLPRSHPMPGVDRSRYRTERIALTQETGTQFPLRKASSEEDILCLELAP
jgi:hypothetical protein